MLPTVPPSPTPRLYAGWCRCRCHDQIEGDSQAAVHRSGAALALPPQANGLGGIAVGVKRVDEAAVACDLCRGHHAAVFSGPPDGQPPLPKPHRAEPRQPAPAPRRVTPAPVGEWKDDASGSTYHAGGEGAE